tara:strand:- start:351 stop:1268 length:918 start_codon:yes stop_codon:yes gene_type:complete
MRTININFEFMKWHKSAVYVSIFLILLSIFSIFAKGFNYGVDFKGGTIIEIGFSNEAPIDEIRDFLNVNNYSKSSAQYFGSKNDILIRMPNIASVNESNLSNNLVLDLKQEFNFSLKRVEYVGAQVGEELRDQGILAALIALILIMIYIALRFEYRFSIGAILALIHDVILIMGIFSVSQIEFNLSVFAAILAVIGYSLNDTIVVFDRIRENFKAAIIENTNTVSLVNQSINQTLSRTLITSLTTILVLISLIIFGGEILFGFSFALLIGVIIGTYSSIYIASSTLLLLNISAKDVTIEVDEEQP